MAQPPRTDQRRLAREQRYARLAAELRSNLNKRKAQARGRALRDGLQSDGVGESGDLPDEREAPAGVKRAPA